MFKALWVYRSFILGSVKREFQSRYLGSLLGATWTILSPLALIIVYTVVFSRVMHARLPGVDDTLAYGIFLCAGILTWGYFVEVMNRSISIFISQGNLIKKNVFPRSCLPLIVFFSASVNFLIIFSLFLGFLLITDRFPGWVVFGFVPLLLLQQTFAIALGLILGTLNVFYRDVGQLMGVVFQFWFWLTPIVYPVSILPDQFRDLILTWNPLAALILGYQGIVVQGKWPEWELYTMHAIGVLLLLLAAYFIFSRLSGEMVDEL